MPRHCSSRVCRRPRWDDGARNVESAYLLVEAWVVTARGRVTEARRISGRAVEFARTGGQFARGVTCLQAAAQFGATDVETRLAQLATRVDGPRAEIAAMYAHALAIGDAAGLEAASRDFEDMGDVLASADAAVQAATCYRRAGRRGGASTAVLVPINSPKAVAAHAVPR